MTTMLILCIIGLLVMFGIITYAAVSIYKEKREARLKKLSYNTAIASKYYQEFVKLNEEYEKKVDFFDDCKKSIACSTLSQYRKVDLNDTIVKFVCNDLDIYELIDIDKQNLLFAKQYEDALNVCIENAQYFVSDTHKNDLCKNAFKELIAKNKLNIVPGKIIVEKHYSSSTGRSQQHDSVECTFNEALDLMATTQPSKNVKNTINTIEIVEGDN